MPPDDEAAIRFLRRSASELRRMAEIAPEIAADLRRLADEIEAEADAREAPRGALR